ncbi:predicted protein [Naegleria gruberi]|uniref:Predicted protein n=1 Tax=Naegleria gruberi TaxID=5762 RepID=D2W3W8_NAEGR|nr:uncharacterized protein NAEGRDRAFT_54504 [Naegleria gruberi]EFC36245.1 predicted protein [Naegleria gruberi]|eukprot:XP_002668989.1 predicted protein [Naegleria gruberi strain NEG-M]
MVFGNNNSSSPNDISPRNRRFVFQQATTTHHHHNHHHHHHGGHHHEQEDDSLVASGELVMRQNGFFGRWKKFFFTLTKDGAFVKFKTSDFHTPMQTYFLIYSHNLVCDGHKNDKYNMVTTEAAFESPTLPQPANNLCGKSNSMLLFVENSVAEKETLVVVAPSADQYNMWMRAFEIVFENAKYEMTVSTMIDGTSSSSDSGSSFTSHESYHSDKQITFDIYKKGLKISNLIDAMTDPTVIANDKGIIIGVNGAAEAMFEWKHIELIGENVKVLMPTVFAKYHDEFINNYKKTRKQRMIGKPRNVLGKTKNGRTFTVEISVGEISGRMSSDMIHSSEHENIIGDLSFMAVFRIPFGSSFGSSSDLSWDSSSMSSSESFNEKEKEDEHDFNTMIEASVKNFSHHNTAPLPPRNLRLNISSSKSSSAEDVFNDPARSYSDDDSDSSSDSDVEQYMISPPRGGPTHSALFNCISYSPSSLQERKEKIYKRVEKIEKRSRTLKDNEFNKLKYKFLLLEKQIKIMEEENEKLFTQLETQRESIELLERESRVMLSSPEVSVFIDMANSPSSYESILKWATKNGKLNHVRCCKSIIDFSAKYSKSMKSASYSLHKQHFKMEKNAREIFDEFFSSHAKHPVILSEELADTLLSHLDTPTSHMFTMILYEIITTSISSEQLWNNVFSGHI